MTVRSAIEERLQVLSGQADDGLDVRLVTALKSDGSVRTSMLKRLSASMRFSYGAKSGALKTAVRRSGSGFRIDVRQRVIVKALVSRHAGRGMARGAALLAHVRYLARNGAGIDGEAGDFFDRNSEGLNGAERTREWAGHRHHFRFIVSPEHGDRIADLQDYVRDVMGRVCADLGEPELSWLAVCHYDTDQPHAHVLLPGRRADERDLVIPRDYIAYGFRARAQEAAQERLGDLSRLDAERRVWRETQRDGFTGFDRRLLASVDGDRMVPDAAGAKGAWAALTRGRLLQLEALGLARRHGRRFELDEDMEGQLRRLQVSRDVIRTINQRRFETGRRVEIFREGRVSGEVTKSGFHDELGTSPYVVLKDVQGVEHYARVAVGTALPSVGAQTSFQADELGRAQLVAGLDKGRGIGI